MRKAIDIKVDDTILGNYGLGHSLPADSDSDATAVTRHRVTAVTANTEQVLDADQNVVDVPSTVVIEILHPDGTPGTLFLDPNAELVVADA